MSASSDTSLYKDVLRVTHVYLGPAAQRFIDRQVESHLQKPPATLTPDDLLALIDWIKISVSMLTEDSEIVEEYVGELHKLVERQPKPKRRGGTNG